MAAAGQITGVPRTGGDGRALGDGTAGRSFLERLAASQRLDEYRQEHWQGSFAEYLDVVKTRPDVTRSAYQRMYDMIMSYGSYTVGHPKENLVRYRFFDDPDGDGHDAIF